MSTRKERIKELTALGIALLLCLTALIWSLRLWEADLRVPFAYGGGDVFIYSMFIKGTMDGGWPVRNKLLGAPGGLDLHDFPINDGVSLLIIKFFSLFTSSFGRVFNLFFLINYPLTVLVTYLVLRQLRLGRPAAVVGSLLYAFLPYHFSRAIGHCFYAVYYAVPLVVMVLLWVASGELSARDVLSREGLIRHRKKLLVCLLACLLVSSTGGFYFAFFAIFLLFSVGLQLAIRQRDLRGFILPGALVAAIIAGLALNVIPNLIYIAKHGKNQAVAVRQPTEADLLGLKISQLLLPTQYHLIPWMADLKELSLKNPLTNENRDSTLGVVGGAGFLILLGWLLYRRRDARPEGADQTFPFIDHLSMLNASSLLLATIGGFGSLFALLVSPQIRAYNRISVYIAFFSILTVLLLLEHFSRRHLRRRRQAIAYHVFLALVLVLGLLDEVGRNTLEYSGPKAQYLNDREFVKKIEGSLPDQAMVFQLPQTSFPESGPRVKMLDYDHFRGYLHSRRLRWSYGAMRGRRADLWQQSISSRPVYEMVETLAEAGFGGIYLDRFGYEDGGANMEAELTRTVGAPSFASRDGRLVFFDLTSYQRKLKEKYSPGELAARSGEALSVMAMQWGEGFYGLESQGEENWRWSQPTGELKIINGSAKEKRIRIDMELAASQASNLVIESSLFSEKLRITNEPLPFSKEILVPPGEHVITFNCDAPPVRANDPRTLIFRVNNFRWAAI